MVMRRPPRLLPCYLQHRSTIPALSIAPAGGQDCTVSPAIGVRRMPQRTLGTLTIGQAPRPDVVPIIDAHVPESVRRVHRGVLDGLSRADIDRRYRAEPGEPALITRLHDGGAVELSPRRMQDGVQDCLAA